jgi:Membrane proteins related to metalloendopeptidases
MDATRWTQRRFSRYHSAKEALNVAKDSSEKRRSSPPLARVSAAAAILVLLFGGGWSAISPSSKVGAGPGSTEIEVASLSKRLELDSMSAVAKASGPNAAAAAMEGLVRASRLAGIDSREALAGALPPANAVLGMLSLDRDIDDFLEYADRDDAGGAYYREEARLSLEYRPMRRHYEEAYAAAYCALSGVYDPEQIEPGSDARKPPYLASPSEMWLPPRQELALSHPYALDCFFYRVDKSGDAERGPSIHALYPGIVVAAASDWSGKDGISTWRGGGLSPAAGNGLVIYDPATRRYCSYFHMSSIVLRVGDIVGAGMVLGHGGNSGMNARKNGHGEHLHIEVFDCERNEPLSSYEIRDILAKK